MAGGNLNLSGFTGQPDNADWLYQLGDTLQRNKFFNERAAEREQAQQDKEEGRQASNAEFFTNYLNKKDHLTGTNYDPVKNDLINEALNQAYTLSSQKVPLPNILQAVGPLVDKLNQYDAKAKMYDANKKQWLENNKNIKGVNPDAVIKEADQMAFYDKDPKTGQLTLNVDKADPSHNYYADVLQNSDNPNIFNNEGLNDFVKTSGHVIQDQTMKTRDAKGKISVIKADINAPSYMQSETDAQGAHIGFVPKHDIATEGDSHLFHTFKDDKGNDIKKPVRMITDDVWRSLPDAVRARFIQETRRLIAAHPDSGVNIESPQAEHLGKAIAFEDLDNNSKDYSTFKRTDVQMQPLPHYTNNFYANQNQPQQVIDLYNGDKNNKGVKEIVFDNESKGYGYTRFNQLPVSAQNVILKITKESSGDKELNYSNLYVNSLPTGEIVVRKVPDNGKIMPEDIKDGKYLSIIDPQSLNIPVNINATKVGTGKTKTETINTVIDTGNKSATNKTYNIKGKSYSHSELNKLGYTDDQINQAVKKGTIK